VIFACNSFILGNTKRYISKSNLKFFKSCGIYNPLQFVEKVEKSFLTFEITNHSVDIFAVNGGDVRGGGTREIQ